MTLGSIEKVKGWIEKIENGETPALIICGPNRSGKTTLVSVICQRLQKVPHFMEFELYQDEFAALNSKIAVFDTERLDPRYVEFLTLMAKGETYRVRRAFRADEFIEVKNVPVIITTNSSAFAGSFGPPTIVVMMPAIMPGEMLRDGDIKPKLSELLG